MSLNAVTITGFVARSGVLSTSLDGSRELRFSLAYSEWERNAEGKWEKSLSFVDCVLRGERANFYFKYLVKWRYVTVSGKLHQDKLAAAPSRGFVVVAKSLDLHGVANPKKREVD